MLSSYYYSFASSMIFWGPQNFLSIYIQNSWITASRLNPFHANAPFPYLLKTPKNLWFSVVLRVIEIGFWFEKGKLYFLYLHRKYCILKPSRHAQISDSLISGLLGQLCLLISQFSLYFHFRPSYSFTSNSHSVELEDEYFLDFLDLFLFFFL